MKLTARTSDKSQILNIIIPIILVIITLPLISRAFTSRNEYRYVEIADSIIKSKNPFVYYVNGMLYTDKPPLYFWIMIASRFLFGSFYTYGVVIFNIVIESLVLMKLNRLISGKYGFKSSIILLFLLITSILQYISLILVRMDIFLSSFITLALLEFWECYEKDSYRNVYKVYIYTGLAFLFKGLVGLLTPFLVIIAFRFLSRKRYSFKEAGLFKGFMTVILFILFWLIPAYITTGYPFLENLFMKQVFARTVIGSVHKQPFYYYIFLFPFIFFPWSIAVIYASYKYIGDFISKKKFSDMELFLIIWTLITIFYLSMSSSKLVIYLLPIVTPALILTFIKFSEAEENIRNRIYIITFIIFLCTIAAIPFADGRDFLPFRNITEICFIFTASVSAILFITGHKNFAYYSFGLLILFITVGAGINISFINKQIRTGKKATYTFMKESRSCSQRKEIQYG